MESREMQLTNIYANKGLKEPVRFKSGYGNAFILEQDGGEVLLFDTGDKGTKILKNMELIRKHPDDIDKIVLSHGHFDHTGGLPAIVSTRSDTTTPVPIHAHPDARNDRKGTGDPSNVTAGAGFPDVDSEFDERVTFIDTIGLNEICNNIHAISEIMTRPEKDGCDRLLHFVNGNWIPDPMKDDLSLILETGDGIVLLCGCCHAGLLNTLLEMRKSFDQRVHAVVGGTHMMGFTETELDHVAEVLQQDYDSPSLYLNHCSGEKTVQYLASKLGDEKVNGFPAGSVLEFSSP